MTDPKQLAVPEDYYRRERPELLALIPGNVQRVLDVGCGEGALASRIKQRPGIKEVVGIEKNEQAARIAAQHLDKVVIGDFEELSLQFPQGYFDCIICADVLEHLADPWSALRRLRFVLADNGVLLASLPNIRNTIPILKILFNRWQYEEEGIIDKTHLRFFTLYTMKQMFCDAGFAPRVVGTNFYRDWKFRIVHIISLGLLKPFSIYQYFILARKKDVVASSPMNACSGNE